MAKITKTVTKITVRTTANSKEYEVEFDHSGEIVSVSTRFRRGCDYRFQNRTIYTRRQLKPMSLTAAIAGRSAVADLEKSAVKRAAR